MNSNHGQLQVKNYNAEHVIHWAREYYQAYLILSRHNNDIQQQVLEENPYSIGPVAHRKFESGEWMQPHIPPITTLAFAIELYLKSILVYHGKKPPEVHSIWTLFRRLPDKVQQFLRKHCRTPDNQMTQKKFNQYIKADSHAFDKWRYGYELGQCSYFENFAFMLVEGCRKWAKEEGFRMY